MKSLKVRDLMVELEGYATVSMEATLYEAIRELDKVHQTDHSLYRHRAVLVFDEKDRVIGKLGLFEILIGLESKYSEIGDLEKLAGLGLSSKFVKSLLNQYSFWSRPLEQTCRDAAEIKVADIMHILTENEYIQEEAPLGLAMHQLIMGQLQSLIVTRGDEIVGILKLSDVFRQVSVLILDHRRAE